MVAKALNWCLTPSAPTQQFTPDGEVGGRLFKVVAEREPGEVVSLEVRGPG